MLTTLLASANLIPEPPPFAVASSTAGHQGSLGLWKLIQRRGHRPGRSLLRIQCVIAPRTAMESNNKRVCCIFTHRVKKCTQSTRMYLYTEYRVVRGVREMYMEYGIV